MIIVNEQISSKAGQSMTSYRKRTANGNHQTLLFAPRIQTILYSMMYEPGNYITPMLDVDGRFCGGERHASPRSKMMSMD